MGLRWRCLWVVERCLWGCQEFIEPPEFQGLLYCDGLDALGRPVVVVNADAVAEDRHARRAAFQYLLYQLEPIVVQVSPVLHFLNNEDYQEK